MFFSLMLILPGAVVRFDGLGLDDDGGVAALPCLRTGRDGSGDVAGTQSQARRQCRQCRNQHGDDDFDDFCFGHNVTIFLFDEGQYK